MSKMTKVIIKELYPLVEKGMTKNLTKYKGMISRFIEKRHIQLYETAPYDRIFYTEEDAQDFWKSINVSEADVNSILKKTYYADIAAFNPRAAKDAVTCTCMCIIRYFYSKRMDKELELSYMYLSFSGKFYPSIHYSSFPTVEPSQYRHIMEYVVNNMLTNKFDLKTQGSVIGAVKSIGKTWSETYERLFKSFEDDDVVYLIQQLHDRIKSFMQNIASLYYTAYENKDVYMTYDSDSLDENNYHLADNDSLKAERVVEKTMEKLNNTTVDYKLCKMSSDSNIKTEEIKTIIETIVTDKDSYMEVKELVRLLTVTYFEQSNKKDVRDIDFITFSIAAKPNTKDKNILRIKEIIENWLNENSNSYRKRKSRLATKNSYNKAVLLYFVLLIHNANK